MLPTLAIVGRRNVGKSTLLNALAGAQRSVTGSLPGLTREPVEMTVNIPRPTDRATADSQSRQRRRKVVATQHGEDVPEGAGEDAADSRPQDEEALPTPVGGDDVTLHVRMVDTAGLRTTAEVHAEGDFVESSVREHTLSALKTAHVIALVMDVAELVDAREGMARDNTAAEIGIARADQKLIKIALEEGKAVMLVFNKIDALPPHLRTGNHAKLYGRIRAVLPRWIAGGSGDAESGFESAVPGRPSQVPILLISALEGENIDDVRRHFVEVYDKWSITLPTPVLRRWTDQLQQLRPPPNPLSLRYMRQISSRPPTFALYVGRRK